MSFLPHTVIVAVVDLIFRKKQWALVSERARSSFGEKAEIADALRTRVGADAGGIGAGSHPWVLAGNRISATFVERIS